MKVLSFTTYPTLKPIHGGQRRLEAMSQFYATRGHELHVASVYEHPPYGQGDVGAHDYPYGPYASEWDSVPFVTDYLSGPFAAENPAAFRHFQSVIARIQPDAVQLDHPFMWPLLKRLREDPAYAALPVIYSSHNFEGPLKADLLRRSGVPAARARLAGRLIEALEAEVCEAAALVLAVSEGDAKAYRALAHADTPVLVVPNGIARPPERIDLSAPALKHFGDRRIMLFVGSAYPPNIAGFCDLVAWDGFFFLPPQQQVAVCGGASDEIFKDHVYHRFVHGNSARVQFFPKIDDNNLFALKHRAHVMLLPITYGGGSNLKTAEALGAGHHVVATRVALRGFEHFVGAPGVTIADEPQAFKTAMIDALHSDPLVLSPEDRTARDSVFWDVALAASGLGDALDRVAQGAR